MSNDGGFDWPTLVRPFSVPGLSSCLEEGRLTLDGVRVGATWVDLYSLRLVEWAIATKQSLILCPPEPFGPLAALTAAAAHIWSMARHYEETGHREALGSHLRVAVATSNYRLRGIYRRLGIGTARLFGAVPAATLTRGGHIAVLGHDGDRSWSTVFVSRPSDIRLLDGVDLAVIELPLRNPKDLAELDIPMVLIAHDPADPLLATLARDIPLFAWDDDDLRSLQSVTITEGPALSAERRRLERVAAGVTRRPLPIPAPRICENAALFWQDIGPLLRAGGRSLFAQELAAAAFVLFYDLLHLAIPTAIYEAASRPLRIRIAEIARAQRVAQGDLKELYLPMVTQELRDLAAAVGEASPKTEALLALLRERSGRHEDILLVARTAELARAYASYLERFPDLAEAVRVTSLWGVSDEPPADVAVFVGLLPTSARYLYTTGLAAEIVVLAYEAAETLESVPGGFTECSHVRTAIAYQQEYAAWLSRDAAKAACWERLSGEPSSIPDLQPFPPRVRPSAVPLGELPPPPDVPPDLWDGTVGSLAMLEERVRRDLPPQLSPTPEGESESVLVESLRVEFTDGRWMFLEVDGTVTKFHSNSGLPEAGHPARSIAAGDRLVLLDGEAKKDLLAKVLEVAGELPEFAVRAAWIDYWRQALRRARTRFSTYERMRQELGERGCIRERQTVRLWVVGQTIGPEDPEDIRRLGECLEDEVLVANYTTINGAIESLRSAHRALGHRLGALARRVGSATSAGFMEEDEIIDARTGLTAADFRDSVEILVVHEVAPAGSVPYAVTGRLRASDQKEVEIV